MKPQSMLEEIAIDAAACADLSGRATIAPQVIDAMEKVARHRFVPDEVAQLAYLNRPLPIGCGQTISQPFIVALMTDLIEVAPGDKVLEIGTGSGYQAAVLAQIGARVYSIEIIEQLKALSDERLAQNGYQAINTRLGDGYFGWPDAAPFDAIVVTAAAARIPQPLIEQLKPGGRMVIPLGSPWTTQSLMLVEKHPDGQLASREILPVSFVPLTGEH